MGTIGVGLVGGVGGSAVVVGLNGSGMARNSSGGVVKYLMFMIALRSHNQQVWMRRLLAGLGVIIVMVFAAYHLAYWGKIYPQVSVGNVDLSNKTSDQAETLLED